MAKTTKIITKHNRMQKRNNTKTGQQTGKQIWQNNLRCLKGSHKVGNYAEKNMIKAHSNIIICLVHFWFYLIVSPLCLGLP